MRKIGKRISAFGMSSLNWADLVAHVFAGEAWMPSIHAQMLEAYRSATAFIKLTPGMARPDLPNGRWAGPVARLGIRRHDELRARCGAARGECTPGAAGRGQSGTQNAGGWGASADALSRQAAPLRAAAPQSGQARPAPPALLPGPT